MNRRVVTLPLLALLVAGTTSLAVAADKPHAKGTVHVFIPGDDETPPTDVKFELNVKEHGAEEVKGHLRMEIRDPGGRTELHVDVDCVEVSGNRAWLSGPVTRAKTNEPSVDPLALLNFTVIVGVEDNGGKAPDRFGFTITTTGVADCHDFHPDLLFESDEGNVKVTP